MPLKFKPPYQPILQTKHTFHICPDLTSKALKNTRYLDIPSGRVDLEGAEEFVAEKSQNPEHDICKHPLP